MSSPKAQRPMRLAASVCRKVLSTVSLCAVGLCLSQSVLADRVLTLEDDEVFGRLTLERGADTVTITPKDGAPTKALLEDIDNVAFGEQQAISDGDLLLINNDTTNPTQGRTGTVKLRAGLHRFVVPYWQSVGNHVLSLRVTGPGIPAPDPLSNNHMVCFRSSTDKHEPSKGIDAKGFRLPELPLKSADNVRKMQTRSKYRLYIGDANTPFQNVGVLNNIPLRMQGTTEKIETGFVGGQTHFAIVFEGFFIAKEDGEYTFTLASDDGAQLYLGEASKFMVDALGSTQIEASWKFNLCHNGLALGKLKGIAENKLMMHMPLVSDVSFSLSHVRSLWDSSVDQKSLERGKEAPGQDTAYIRDKNDPKKIVPVSGKVISLNEQALSFEFRGQARNITRDRVAGLVLDHSDRPEPADPGLYQVLKLRGGQVLPCKLISLDDIARFKLLGADEVAPPREVLYAMRSENGRRVDLTTVKPTAEETIPYFGLKLPHRVNRTFEDMPIKLFDGEAYERGLAVHSKSRLHYKLERPAERFKARLGLMDPGGRMGDITARVLGDGKVLWEQAGITAQSRAVDINVPLDGVKRLVLEVDFGQGQGVGDRAAWCNPQVIYAAKP